MTAAQRIALLAFLVAGTAKAQTLVWESNFGAAILRARAEKRLILADVRSDCARCNQKIESRLKWAELHESIVASLRTFVLVRDARAPKNLARSSALVLVDPASEPVVELPLDSDDGFANALLQVRAAAPTILHSSERRLAGDVAGADMDFGLALLLLREPRRAAARLEAASHAYEARHDVVNARLAEIQQGFAIFASGGGPSGFFVVERALRNATTDDVRASAWLALGAMQRIQRHAISSEAYRNAYRFASPGSEVLAEAREVLAASDDEPLPSKEGPPAKGMLRILVPARRTIAGKADFIAECDSATTRVDFFLDDTPAGTATRPPFRIRIDLGPSPRVRRIKAIAYDAIGRAIAENVATVNDRADALRVNIVAPSQKNVAGKTLIAADVVAPEKKHIAQVEFFWKELLLGRIDKPPYQVTHDLPAEFGYVRVVREDHKGLTWARQCGFKAAQGELLAYIDSDVHVPAGWIDIIYQEFAKRPSMVSLSGPSRYYDLEEPTKFLAEIGWNLVAPLTYRLVGYMVYGANFVARKKALEAIGGFDTNVAFYGEDTNLARRLAQVGKTVFLMRFFVSVSGRRIIEEGLIKTYWVYAKNYLSEVFLHRPTTKEYKDHR